MTDAEKAEKMLLGDVCSECGDPLEETVSGLAGLCPVCNKKKEKEDQLLVEREDEENRKHLRPGEMLADDYFRAFFGKLPDPLEGMFLCEVAIVFDWGPLTRPLTRKIQKEWWYIEGRRRSNSQWNLSGFDVAFVQQMVDNLVRCGIFTIEGEMWTFKGFPKGWERKWRKGKSYRVKSFIKKTKGLSDDQMMEEKKVRTRKRGRIPRQSGMPLRDSSNKVRSRLPKTDSKSRPRWSAKAKES